MPHRRASWIACALLTCTAALGLLHASLTFAQQATPPRPPGASAHNALGLGSLPDPVAAKRGSEIFAANCSFCHGSTARGAEGPSLLTSDIVLGDDHGEKLAAFLKEGRPDRGMPSFAQVDRAKLVDIAEYLHQLVENYANRGLYEVANIVTGDPTAGKVYFASHCAKCHSVDGDLAHIASRYKPADLQRNWISPPRNSPKRAIVATVVEGGKSVSGTLLQLSDFSVSVRDASGTAQTFSITPATKISLADPLAFHMDSIPTLRDDDMHNITAFLEQQK
jgi:mono/diheme cytochrome c family protein